MLFALLIAVTANDPTRCLASIDDHGFVRSQMLDCAIADMDRADKALNAAYSQTLARIDPSDRARLRRDERGWIAHRRALCRAAARDPIPSPEINRMRCLERETVARTIALRAMR